MTDDPTAAEALHQRRLRSDSSYATGYDDAMHFRGSPIGGASSATVDYNDGMLAGYQRRAIPTDFRPEWARLSAEFKPPSGLRLQFVNDSPGAIYDVAFHAWVRGTRWDSNPADFVGGPGGRSEMETGEHGLLITSFTDDVQVCVTFLDTRERAWVKWANSDLLEEFDGNFATLFRAWEKPWPGGTTDYDQLTDSDAVDKAPPSPSPVAGAQSDGPPNTSSGSDGVVGPFHAEPVERIASFENDDGRIRLAQLSIEPILTAIARALDSSPTFGERERALEAHGHVLRAQMNMPTPIPVVIEATVVAVVRLLGDSSTEPERLAEAADAAGAPPDEVEAVREAARGLMDAIADVDPEATDGGLNAVAAKIAESAQTPAVASYVDRMRAAAATGSIKGMESGSEKLVHGLVSHWVPVGTMTVVSWLTLGPVGGLIGAVIGVFVSIIKRRPSTG